jgi:hypothetical protein
LNAVLEVVRSMLAAKLSEKVIFPKKTLAKVREFWV